MEDHILERSIFNSTNAFQERERKNPGSELYRLKMQRGDPTTLADLVHNMCIGGVMDVMDDLRKKGYRSVGLWGSTDKAKLENHEIGIVQDLDGSLVAYDPTIAQTNARHAKRVVRIWKARNSKDLEQQLLREFGGKWNVKDAVDRANNLNMENPQIAFFLGNEEVTLNNYFMFEPLPESENWIIETPTMPNPDNFRNLLQKILPFALQECHPLLRKCKGIIQFVEKLEHDTGRGEQMGHAHFMTSPDGKEALARIRVSLNSLKQHSLPQSSWEISALGVVLHELFEIDYNLRAQEADRSIEKHPLDANYAYAGHELISNNRVLRIIKKFFGDDYTFDSFKSGMIIKMPDDLKLWGNYGKFQTDLELIQNSGHIYRDVVPYLHKDDYNFGNLMDTIRSKLKEQRRTGSLRLGVVVGTGALLSIAPDVDVDAWLVLDNNAFVLEWSQRTITAIRNTKLRSQYISWVYNSQQAEAAKAKKIDPKDWLRIEMQALDNLHFLDSDSRFAQAKQKLTETPVLFCQGDLSNRQYMEELAQVLQSHNAEIAFANLTDVLEFAPPIGDVIGLLPFRDDAVIAWATRSRSTINHPVANVSIGIKEYTRLAIEAKKLLPSNINELFGKNVARQRLEARAREYYNQKADMLRKEMLADQKQELGQFGVFYNEPGKLKTGERKEK